MSDVFKPGIAVIEKAELRTADGKKSLDIVSQVAVVEIYEDITLPIVTATLTIVDSSGLAERFPITGTELIVLKFKTDVPKSKSTEFVFRIHEVKNITNLQHKKLTAYVLKCVDVDVLDKSKKTVHNGYKKTHSEMVQDICTNMIENSVKVEPSKGIQDLVVPGVNPYKAIDLIRKKATSTSYEYSPYTFFRTMNDGFFFATFANLFQTGKSSPKRKLDRIYMMMGDVTLDPYKEFNNILSIAIPEKFKSATKAATGSYSSSTSSFDIVTKKYTSNNFKLAEAKFLDIKDDSYKAYVTAQGQDTSINHFIVTDSSKPDTHEKDTLGMKSAYITTLLEDGLSIDIHGDNEIAPGDVVNLNLPMIVALTSEDIRDPKYFNGDYLVTKVKHVIQRDVMTRYKTTLQLVRGSRVYA